MHALHIYSFPSYNANQGKKRKSSTHHPINFFLASYGLINYSCFAASLANSPRLGSIALLADVLCRGPAQRFRNY